MFTLFAKLSAKAIATFVVWIVFFLLCFMFAPGVLTTMQKWSQGVENFLYEPSFLSQQQTILWHTLVNDTTILGVFTTVVSRFFVEMIAYVTGNTWQALRSKSADAKADAVASEASSIKYD